MALEGLLQPLLVRLQEFQLRKATQRYFSFGFVTAPPDSEMWTLRTDATETYKLEQGLANAFIVFKAPLPVFENLVNSSSSAEVNALLEEVAILPHDYANQIATFLHKLLDIEVDALPLKPSGTFPMPIVHPAGENTFHIQRYEPIPIPVYDPLSLPALIVDDHPEWVTMYDWTWQQAFKNFRQPEPESGFVANYIDTAFNDNTFMWDSCFMTMFGHYARREFSFLGTLDNFYGKQHSDGYMCREINTYDGRDLFTPQDSRSTGPNIMGWTEWIDYQHSGDEERLRRVFPALVAYHRWWQHWRTWPDGSYWNSGWGSGMDNQIRMAPDDDGHYSWKHYHYSWIDAMMQQALSCHILLSMAEVIDRNDFTAMLQEEYDHLSTYINEKMWDETSGYYYDRGPDGSLSTVKSISVLWGALAGVIPADRMASIFAQLDDPAVFNRPHRVPSQSADNNLYKADGSYWLGGVWPPTNYMTLRALTENGADDLAFDIAFNHVENVAEVFAETNTIWENYAPESAAPGNPAKPDFVGWTGISTISVPIEYLVGIRASNNGSALLWDIRLTERHGVERYPVAQRGTATLVCAARENADAPATVTITTDSALDITIQCAGRQHSEHLQPGEHVLTV